MKRLSYRLYRMGTALNYQLSRRLTKGGMLAGACMILVGAIGSDLDQSVAFQAFALTFSLLLVAFCWAPWFRGRFMVRRSLPKLATVDQPFQYRVEVRGLSGRAYRDLEILEDLTDPRPTYEEFVRLVRPSGGWRRLRPTRAARSRLESRHAITRPAVLPRLAPGRSAETQVEVVPLRRGPLRFDGVTVARRDPLGLVRGFVRAPLPESVLVLPKRYRLPPLMLAGSPHYQPGGVSFASSVGESEEFISLRDYRPGDAFRRIHWRSWARVGRPIVKEYQDENFVRQGLILDTYVDGDQVEAFEEAVSVAASFACTLENQESLLDLLFVGAKAYCFTTGRGLGTSEQVLQVLASVQASAVRDFEALRTLVLQHRPLLSACTCVFVGWDEPRRDLVRSLRAVGLPVLPLLVTGGPAANRPGYQTSLAAEGVHLLRLGQVDRDLLALERMAA